MKKSNGKKRHAKKVAKYISTTALAIPLIITGPTMIEQAVAQSALEDWMYERVGGGYIEIGEQITLDLKQFLHGVVNPQFTVINHNDPVATVKIQDGKITLSGKREGSTTVDLLVKSGDDGLYDSLTERFRFEVIPVAGLMMEGRGLRIDDLVRYLQDNPEKSYQQEGLSHLLGHISPLHRSINRLPEAASEQTVEVIVLEGEQAIFDLRDFYFDSDGDALDYEIDYLGEDLQVEINDNYIYMTGVTPIEHAHVTVTAYDPFGSNGVEKKFLVTVIADQVNTPPQVEGEIPDQTITEGEAFNYTVPEETFRDADKDDTLTYTATLEHGEPLPIWLSFDPETRTFSGIPSEKGAFIIQVTVTDRSAASVSTTFQLTIEEMIHVPMALYEDIALTFYPYTQMSVDLTQLFTDADDDEWKIFADDDGELVDRGHWSNEGASMVVDLVDHGMLYVLTSGDMSAIMQSSLEFQFKAGHISEQLWSESVLFTVNLEQPNTAPTWTVEAGAQVSLSELFHDSFGHYTLDGIADSFTYEITSALHWAEPDPDDPDLIHVHADLEASEFTILVRVKAGNIMTMNKSIKLQITKDGELDDGQGMIAND